MNLNQVMVYCTYATSAVVGQLWRCAQIMTCVTFATVWATTDATSCRLSFRLGASPSPPSKGFRRCGTELWHGTKVRCKVWHTSGDLLASIVRLAGIGRKVEALAEAGECNTPTPTTVKDLRAAR